MKRLGIVCINIVLILSFTTSSWAGFKIGGSVGSYAPHFQQVNYPPIGFGGFRAGTVYVTDLSYDVSPKIEIRLEYDTFESIGGKVFGAHLYSEYFTKFAL